MDSGEVGHVKLTHNSLRDFYGHGNEHSDSLEAKNLT